MKRLLLFILLIPTLGIAQLKSGYLHVYGGSSWSNEATTKGIAGLSGGVKLANTIGVGAGAGYIQFEKAYIPVTIDLSLIPSGRKINPIAGIKAGYGFFNYQPSTGTTVRGGFVSTAFAGITLSAIKLKPNLTVGGTRYVFRSAYPNKTVATDDKRIFAAIGFLF